MKRTFFLSLLIFLSGLIYGQLGFSYYGKPNGDDVIYQVTPAGPDEFYVLGGKYVQKMEIWLAKMYANGEIIWQHTYGTDGGANYYQIGYHLLIANDSTFYITGQERHTFLSEKRSIVIKTDVDGHQIWKKSYDNVETIYNLIQDGDDLLAAGYDGWDGVVMRMDTAGTVISRLLQDVSGQTYVHAIFPQPDGNLLLAGRANTIGAGYSGLFFRKITPAGDVISTRAQETTSREEDFWGVTEMFEASLGIVQDDDGTIWIANHGNEANAIELLHFSGSGEFIKSFHYGNGSYEEHPTSLLKSRDGHWIIAGSAENDTIFALKVGINGDLKWYQQYGGKNAGYIAMTLMETDDHFILGGTCQRDVAGDSRFDGTLLRTDKNGNPFPFTINGYLKFDRNQDCLPDMDDTPLSNWFITISDEERSKLLLTKSDGYFEFNTNYQNVHVNIINPDTSLWEMCLDTVSFQVDSANPMQTKTILVSPKKICADLEVSITQPDLIKCDTSCLTATIINRGTMPSEKSNLILSWDKELHLISVSSSFQNTGNGIVVEIPTLQEQQEYRVQLCISLECDVQLGATHLISALIDTNFCSASYTGPFFVAEGWCEGDQVKFSIRNTGEEKQGLTTNYSLFINELLVSDSIEVALPNSNAPFMLSFPADARTWRIQVEQYPEVPYADYPCASVEGCKTHSTGLHDIGLRNAFRDNDYRKTTSTIMASNTVGAPNMIEEVYPGFGDYNIIMEAGELEFTARVKNDIKEVVQDVVFELVFTPTFSISTFRLLSSTVHSEYYLVNDHSIRIILPDINLIPGQIAMARFSIHTSPGLMPNGNNSSFLQVKGFAYLDEIGPILLDDGFNNYNQFEQAAYEDYGIYPDYMLTYGGRSHEFASALQKGDGDFLFLAGSTGSFGYRKSKGYVYKTDLTGRVIWQSVIQLDQPGNFNLYGLAPDGEGGCIFAGSFLPQLDAENYNYTHFYYGAIGRLDASGRVVWSLPVRPAGEAYGTTFSGLIKTADENYIAFGTLDKGEFQRVFFKFDIHGYAIWTQSNSTYKISPRDGLAMPDGSAIFVGDNVYSYEPYTIVHKINPDGHFLWESTLTHGYDSNISSICMAQDAGFVVAGHTTWNNMGNDITTPMIIHCDTSGSVLWTKKPIVPGFDYLEVWSVERAVDEGYFLTGYAGKNGVTLGQDVILIKVDNNGEFLWYKIFGGAKEDIGWEILSPSADAVYIFGWNYPEIILNDLQAFLIRTDGLGEITKSQSEILIPKHSALVFPNPAKGSMNVFLSPIPVQRINWMLFDFTGKPISRGQADATDLFQIEVSGLTSGMYMLTFPGTSYPVQKVIVQ